MKSFLNIALALIIGLGGGGASAWYALQSSHGFGAISIGQWTAWPLAGNVDADPYTEAKVARDGSVPLGAAEGLAFEASIDSTGAALLRQCQYVMEGSTPVARLWTLSAYDEKREVITPENGGQNTIFSRSIIRKSRGNFAVYVGATPKPENWLASSGFGFMTLVLRLYDTPVTSTAGLLAPDMPAIRKIGCLQ